VCWGTISSGLQVKLSNERVRNTSYQSRLLSRMASPCKSISWIGGNYQTNYAHHSCASGTPNVKVTLSASVFRPEQDNPSVLVFDPEEIFGIQRQRAEADVECRAHGQSPDRPWKLADCWDEKDSSFEKEHRFKIIGNFWTIRTWIKLGYCVLDAKENRKTETCIPTGSTWGLSWMLHGPFRGSWSYRQYTIWRVDFWISMVEEASSILS